MEVLTVFTELLTSRLSLVSFLSSLLVAFAFSSLEIRAQGSATNDIGNGGIHSIQGRIYTSNGRRSEMMGMRIRLFNVSSNDLSVIADSNGTFTFRNLIPGTYTIQIDGGDYFENVNESVEIDAPGSSNLSTTIRLTGGARKVSIPIYLKAKVSQETLAALEVINAKLAAVPKPAVEYYEKAQAAIAEGDDVKAIGFLRNALSIHQQFSIAWNLLGSLLQKTSDSTGAVDAFRSAVKHDSSSSVANLNLGCALYNQRSYTEAERYLMDALVLNQLSYRGHYYMGLTQLKLGRTDVAEQAFRRAIEVGSSQAGMAHYMLAGIYWSVKRYKEAAEELEAYLKLEPKAKDGEKIRASIAELRSKQK